MKHASSLAELAIVTLQGKLMNTAAGVPVEAGCIKITIKDPYGTQVWEETLNGVINKGVFNIPVGATSELYLVSGWKYSMIVSIDADSAVYNADDVVFGDNSPPGDIIKFER